MNKYHEMKRLTLIGTMSDGFLGVLKTLLGIFGHSQALLADGINSLSDLAVDGMLLLASKGSTQLPDQEHPYGHGRIETIASVILAIIIILVGFGIAFDAIHNVLHPDPIKPSFVVLIAALISITLNEGLFRHLLKIGKQVNSTLLQANAWHKRSDALTSGVVLIGVIGDMLGLPYCDEGAAIIVALIILKAGLEIIWTNTKELIETGVDQESLKNFMRIAQETPGVKSMHQLRTRLIGGQTFIDIHIQVDPYLSVSEAHYIADHVEKNLMQSPKVEDVVVHVDAENDDGYVSAIQLPDRQTLLKELKKICWTLPGFQKHSRIVLHYLNDKIEIELYLPIDQCDPNLTQQYQQALKDLPNIASVKLFWG